MNENAAQIVYLSLIGIAAGSYVLVAYRGRLGSMLQAALIWLLIFMAALVAYGFRDTIRQQLFPREGVVISGDTIAIPRALDGHFYADLRVNGEKITFVVDTGASDIVLAPQDAEKAGLDPDTLRYLGRARTANGEVRTAGVTINTLEFAGFVDTDVPASVNGSEMDMSLLGMSYLRRFQRFEIVGDRLQLQR